MENMKEAKEVKPARIPYTQVKYLKHVGKINDVKVTARTSADGVLRLYIQDFEFETFESALRFLQEDSRTIAHKSQDLEVLS